MRHEKEFEKELKVYKERFEKAMESGNLAWWGMEVREKAYNC